MITYTPANSTEDLEGILKLQKLNLAKNITANEMKIQGFVTVSHSFALLSKLNHAAQHIIAKHHNNVIAYVLAMTKHSKFDIPLLVPMFNQFETIFYKEKKISACNYIIVGQVCVDKAYRGQGIFKNVYAAYRELYKNKYDFAITEIVKTNLRSIKAHKKIGFQEIHSYFAPGNTEWIVVLWNWKINS